LFVAMVPDEPPAQRTTARPPRNPRCFGIRDRARVHSASNPACPTSRHRCPAFTLVEVLAALLLVAIVVPVVMQGVSLATGAASSAKRRTEGASLAQSKMAEILATERWRGGVLSGQFDADDGHNAGDYGWRAEVTPWTEPYVKELAVHVTWDRSNVEQSVTLTTLVYEGRPEDDEDDEDASDEDTASGAAGNAP
jgi:general secretion pathway protein I